MFSKNFVPAPVAHFLCLFFLLTIVIIIIVVRIPFKRKHHLRITLDFQTKYRKTHLFSPPHISEHTTHKHILYEYTAYNFKRFSP